MTRHYTTGDMLTLKRILGDKFNDVKVLNVAKCLYEAGIHTAKNEMAMFLAK